VFQWKFGNTSCIDFKDVQIQGTNGQDFALHLNTKFVFLSHLVNSIQNFKYKQYLSAPQNFHLSGQISSIINSAHKQALSLIFCRQLDLYKSKWCNSFHTQC